MHFIRCLLTTIYGLARGFAGFVLENGGVVEMFIAVHGESLRRAHHGEISRRHETVVLIPEHLAHARPESQHMWNEIRAHNHVERMRDDNMITDPNGVVFTLRNPGFVVGGMGVNVRLPCGRAVSTRRLMLHKIDKMRTRAALGSMFLLYCRFMPYFVGILVHGFCLLKSGLVSYCIGGRFVYSVELYSDQITIGPAKAYATISKTFIVPLRI